MVRMTTKTVERQQVVTERLRADILDGVFPPGVRLIEVELSERYGVGRGPIRSALVELKTQRLVVHEANRGATVRLITVAEAVEITEARLVLEGLVARRAAERATPAERKELKALISEMRAAVKADDKPEYSRLNRAFHEALQRMARHEVADDLITNLRNRAVHQQFKLSVIPGRAAKSLDQHRTIVDAVVRGDADAAEAAMRVHLASVIDVIRHWEHLDLQS
jgi:DNA-binding GntR family transcriptional regulator